MFKSAKKFISFICVLALLVSVSSPAFAFLYSELTSVFSVEGYTITKVAPETNHISLRASDASGKQNINAVEFNPQNPYTSLRAGMSAGYVYSTQTVNTIATNMSDTDGGDVAVAAVNGDFFDFGVGVPHGIFIDEGRILTTPPQYYSAFGLTYDNEPFIVSHGTILDKEFRIDGVLCDITGINVAHKKDAGSLVLYTSDYARGTKTGTTAYELRCRVLSGDVRHGETLRFVVEEVFDAVGDTALGEGYIVLSAQGERMADLKKLYVGQELEISFRFNEFWSNVKFAVGGNAVILENGEVKSTTDKNREPRTLIGIKADGSVIMATIDGRQTDALGMSYASAAAAMKALGAVDAINLDGGGSTTFVLRKPGSFATGVVNKISQSSPRQVANALVLMNTAPTGRATNLAFAEKEAYVLLGGRYELPEISAYDDNIKPVKLPEDIAFYSESGLNYISDGVFYADFAGDDLISAESSFAIGTMPIHVLSDVSEITSSTEKISGNPGDTFDISVAAKHLGNEVNASPELFTWSVDEAVGSFSEPGKLTLSDSPASGEITVSFGTASLTIPVEKIVPPKTVSDFEGEEVKLVPVPVGTKVNPNWKLETEYDKVIFGSQSLKMYYNFLNTTESVGSYLMIPNDFERKDIFTINDLPKKLGMWVYGDGSGIALRSILEDTSGNQYTISYTEKEKGIDWTGWKYVEAEVPQTIAGPIYIKVPVYVVSNPEKLTHGCLYFENLRAVYSDASGEDYTAPEITKAWPDENMIISTRLPSVGVILKDDTATETDCGINPESVEIVINGYNCTDREFDIATGKISYTIKNALKNGKHTILVRARDKFGNPIVKGWTFEVRA